MNETNKGFLKSLYIRITAAVHTALYTLKLIFNPKTRAELKQAYTGSLEILDKLITECDYRLYEQEEFWRLEKEFNGHTNFIFTKRYCASLTEFIHSLLINYTKFSEIYLDNDNDFKEIYREDLNKVGVIF